MSKNIEVIMPLMGEGVNEATVIKWLKKPGDKVEKEEPIIEISTDKVDTEIPAPESGFLIATFASEGGVIEVDQVIAQISDDPSASVMTPSKSSGHKSVQESNNTSAHSSNAPLSRRQSHGMTSNLTVGQSPLPVTYAGVVRTSPLVRNMAKEHGVDLRQITGTGVHGRITKNDLLDFMQNGGSRVPQIAMGGSVAFDPKGELFTVNTKMEDGIEKLEGVPVRREKMSKMRWLTADHMLRSVRTSPHVTTTFEMDLHRIFEHRTKNKDAFLQETGVNLTFTAYFIEAAIRAIKLYPIVNASVDKDEVLFKDQINIGCAVAVENGLIVPVIKNANDFGLKECALGLSDIATRARSKKLKPDDVIGGTFSITNPGMFGSIHSQPLINQPQVAIMSVGAIIRRPVVLDNDEIAIRPRCQIGLTFDHRIIDGEGGAKFLKAMREFLESYG